MSGEHGKKEVPTREMPESLGKKHEVKTPSKEAKISDNKHKEDKEESTSSINLHKKKGDKKKNKMKKVVYYETNSSAPSNSDVESTSLKRQERKKYNEIPLCYPCIPKRDPLLFVPLGNPPYFDGEYYSMWSDKMRHHLTSLHKSIWDIVEFGA
jgi:hypothetical protein